MKRFIYENYFYKIRGGNLEISFIFKVEPENIYFRPRLVIKNAPKPKINFDNLVFHLGLMEIPSYWKATCSPEIVIEAGYLNKEQIHWWKDLIMKGMSQFFYENKIDFRKIDLKIKIKNETRSDRVSYPLKDRYLVPVGGGRDSIVTLEKLKKRGKKVVCFMVNPTKAALAVHRTFRGLKKPTSGEPVESIVVERNIDPTLLKLNKKGYLNGHTPFTAVLSFLSVFCAVLFGYKSIAFSNEKSADEGNVKYLGRIVNHQWSKSSEFEKKFRFYIKKYLTPGIEYFSFLRKYTELEISKMFTKYPKYFSVFSSCNRVVAKKLKKRWCGSCPKCLFIYATLYPYLEKKQLLKIFGEDLFENKKLLSTMRDLMGQARLRPSTTLGTTARQGSHKPFECVGTYKESKKAFKLSFEKAKKSGKIPYLLKRMKP